MCLVLIKRISQACIWVTLIAAVSELARASQHRRVHQSDTVNSIHLDSSSIASNEATWASLFSGSVVDQHESYRFMVTRHQRDRGITYYGSAERLRVALTRAVTAKKLTVAVVGGSISTGIGATDAPSWVDRVESYLEQTYGAASPLGGHVVLNNGAVPGTSSSYMAACTKLHVPQDADIVLVEYAVNDIEVAVPPLNNSMRRPFERLLRKVLSLPSHPAVVLVNAYAWHTEEPPPGTYWSNAERDYHEFATYYNLQVVSVKACCHAAMAGGRPGFQVARRDVDMEGLKDKVYYYDYVHPDGCTGHRVMAELVIHLFQKAALSLHHHPISPLDHAISAAPLIHPMIRGNHASHKDQCFVGPAFKDKCVVNSDGWPWVNEAKGPRPKWGFVSSTPGKELVLRVNSTATTGGREEGVLVQVAYLRSYEHMGIASVRCAYGCSCNATAFDGHWPNHASLLDLHSFYISQAPDCLIAIAVTGQTSSGGHKVKVAAVMVSEEAGQLLEREDNPAAIEHVHDISFRHEGFGNGTVFDIRNHVR